MTHCVILAILLAAQAAPPQTITPAGRSATQAQGVQGVTGMVPLQVQGVAGATSDVELHDHTTPANHLGVDAAGKIAISNTAFDVTDRIARLVGHVICDSGCSGGAADLALSSAADEALATRAAVTAALRLRDTSLAANAQLIGWRGDATSGAWVNIKNASIAVTGTFWQATQPVSGTFWQATQPVSGTFWQATQPVSWAGQTVAVSNSFALDATLTGGTAKTIVRGGAKGVTAAADVTSTANGADHQGLDVAVQGTVPVSGTFWQATQPVSGTFWQATQPVSGTVTTSPPANASENLAQVAGTTTDTNSGLKSAGTLRVVLATDQPALTNKLLVTPDSVALPANQSVNAAQLAGTTTDTNSGTKSAGTLRVVIATDQPALTNKLLVTPDSVALPANQSVNLAQVGGTNTLTGGTAGSLGVGGLAADGSAVSGNPVLVAGKGFNGIANAIRQNCDKRIAFTTLATTATVQQIALVAGQTIYICGWYALISTATTAVNVKWVTGTGSNCATGVTDVTPLIFTTPTAAPAISNWNQAPMSGPPVAFSASASALCITQSSATNSTTLSGVIYYTQN